MRELLCRSGGFGEWDISPQCVIHANILLRCDIKIRNGMLGTRNRRGRTRWIFVIPVKTLLWVTYYHS